MNKELKEIFEVSSDVLKLYAQVRSGDPKCRGIDEDILKNFFSGDQQVQERVIADFCSGCSVRTPCLRIGIETKSVGIWGGKTEEERKALRRNERRRRTRITQGQ